MTHFLNGEITTESVINLIIAIDADEAQEIDLYYSSEIGGELSAAEVLIDYLGNSIKDITLIGHWGLVSAGLDIFLRAVCGKRLLPDAYGMVHIADIDLSMKSLASKEPRELYLISDTKEYNKKWLQERKDFFTRKEWSALKHGKDLFLNHNRLEEYVKAFAIVMQEETEKEETNGEEVSSTEL